MVGGCINKVVTNNYNLNEILFGLYSQSVLYYIVMRNDKTTRKGKQMTNLKNEIKKINKLSELNELVSFINSYKTMLGKTTLKVGSKVWVVQKTKKTPGVVKKVNIKKALVEMKLSNKSLGLYNVPLAMLEAA